MDTTKLIPWFILLCPLCAAVFILFCTRRHPNTSATISTGAAFFGLVAAVIAWVSPDVKSSVLWLDFGSALQVPLGVSVDHLSKVMLLVVTSIGFLVHLYSMVYMEHDPAKARFFGHLALFMFSMLGIVLADNFAMMFIFWELVGVSSYLLIGHWFTKDAPGKAANKAFIMNRLGDFGFMLGILMLWAAAGTVTFDGLAHSKEILTGNPIFLGTAVLCIFCGTIGKSAQFPLHTWLPDAMEGPTPVSALIHAATMVAAGVYMLARVAFLIELSPAAASFIAWTGGLTSILAALMATQQDDIKRVLAYSTLSQLGYMVMAAGIAPNEHGGPAMFHLFTHAFFKALLFLGAGAIIHALHHEQDIWKMGGLGKRMRITAITFLLGTLALTGFPYLSGFMSKETILLAVWGNKPLFCVALSTAFLTAFYMMRLYIVVFRGEPRSESAQHGHDCPLKMTAPLVILAILAVCAGWTTENYFIGHSEEAHHSLVPMGLAIIAYMAGTGAAFAIYERKTKEPLSFPLFRAKFYFDELQGLFVALQDLLAGVSAFLDGLTAKLARLLGYATWGIGFSLRGLQVGNLQAYAFIFGLGVVGLIWFLIFK